MAKTTLGFSCMVLVASMTSIIFTFSKFNCIFRLDWPQSARTDTHPWKCRHFQYFGVPLTRKVQKILNSPLTLVSLSRIEPAKRICKLVEAVVTAFKTTQTFKRFILDFWKTQDHDKKGKEYLQQIQKTVPQHLTKILFWFYQWAWLVLEQSHFLFFIQNEFYGFSFLKHWPQEHQQLPLGEASQIESGKLWSFINSKTPDL